MQAPLPPLVPNVVPPAGVPAMQAGPHVVPNTYLEKYLDPSLDVFQGNYVNLYNEYAVGNNTPAALRNATYRDGNMGTFLHVLVHLRDPTAGPNDPGTIVALHRLTRHEARLGQAQYPFDNLGLAYYGDVINGQAPSTVVIPDAWFNQVGPVQTPNHGLLTQQLEAHPDEIAVGPYIAGTADVDPITTRPAILVPNKYAAPFLTAGMTPKAAYQTLFGMVQQAGDGIACEPLLDWLRVTLTQRTGAVIWPATCVPPAAPPAFADLTVQQAFVTYRLSVFHADFQHLQPGHQHHSAVLIAQGISALTAEQRLSRTEAQQRQMDTAAPKTPADLFSVQLERLMRWCQVAAEMDLPQIYTTLANTKKGRARVVLQSAVEEALNDLQYVDDFPMSTTLATKIQDLKWHSPMSENFSLGLHLFSLGSLDEETMEQQRQINRHADALYGGEAAPSLLDIMTVQDAKQDVSMPRTFAQLRYLVERSQALWLILLGSQHPVTRAHQDYRRELVTHEKRLERITTRDNSMRFLVPALLGRRIQLAVNTWLGSQARSPSPVAFKSLTDVFDDIEMGLPWEPVFPHGYLQMMKPNAAQPSDISLSGTVGTAASTLTGGSPSINSNGQRSNNAPAASPADTTTRSEIIRNVNFNAPVFGVYRAMNIKAKLLKDQLKTRNVELPNNASGERMCLTYHVHAMCNARCRFASDHASHTAAEDETLLRSQPAPPRTRRRLAFDSSPGVSDRLGKKVASDQVLYDSAASLHQFIRARRGASNLTDDVGHLNHPARHLLHHLSTTGFPAQISSDPWSLSQKDAAIQRGPHQSAFQHVDFLRDELADMVDRATWIVLPYAQLRHLPNLRISPMGVVPQNERRPRPIVDYSFSGVNRDTILLAPREAMQFGRALERLITQVVHSNPRFGPVRFLKIDIADGFYRVWLNIDDIPTLAVSIPSLPGEQPLLALPLALPMGWTESPPAFCTVTETIADLTNHRLHRHHVFPPHRLEPLADAPPPASAADPPVAPPPDLLWHTPVPPPNPLLYHFQRPVAAVDVFVDDFLAIAQPPTTTRTRRTLMHSVDAVFRPLSASDPIHRTEPISLSKLAKGDAAWTTRKQMLGWILDSVDMTLTLPPRRLQRLADLLGSIAPLQKRLSLVRWYTLLGELRSMALALPGSRGLFSHLQQAIRSRQGNRLRLTPAFHRALDDFRWLHQQLHHRPTRLYELVPTAPTLVGTHDASGAGAGGIWLPEPSAIPRAQPALFAVCGTSLRRASPSVPVPVVWRAEFPPAVVSRLVSWSNPHGDVNNSELELLGAYLHDDVAAQCWDVRERTIRSATDNLATLYWYRKGSVTTTSPTATLLRQHAMHQRFHRYVTLKDFVPGPALAPLPHAANDAFLRDLGAAQQAVALGVVPSRAAAAAAQWHLWEEFCASLALSPSLQDIGDPVPYLQVFAHRYRHGVISPSRRLVRGRTVEGALRSVGQTLASVGATDPRLTAQGDVDFRLKRMLSCYSKLDSPPHRVKPIPVPILRHVMAQALNAGDAFPLACADMICLAFFFLLRPGEYTGTVTSSQPFQLRDVRFFLGHLALSSATAPADHLLTATFVSLEFTTQKNGVRGEVIGLGRSGDPHFCPVLAAARRVLHLRQAQAPPTQPLASFLDAATNAMTRLTPADITAILRLSVTVLGAQYGFLPTDVSARSLRAAGAMALLCADVDSDRIRLLGRWQSDQMFRYLHVQAEPLMRNFSTRMLHGGAYTLLPNHNVLPP